MLICILLGHASIRSGARIQRLCAHIAVWTQGALPDATRDFSLDGRSGEVVVTSYWSKAVGDSMRVPDSSWDDMDRVVGTCRRTKGSSSFVDTFL